jgi:hypothetical protein
MVRGRLCFQCAFWKNKIVAPPPNVEVIGGKYYMLDPLGEVEPRVKEKRVYVLSNDGKAKYSNGIGCCGEIPARFRGELPDTAIFITKGQYSRIARHPDFRCKAKGCWDRHHCYWFDTALNVNGEWNEIPSSHRAGGENCESYINKELLYER